MARDKKRRKKEEQSAGEAEDGTATATLPLDVWWSILLKATPLTLWSSRLVCKQWYTLLTSPAFVDARRDATGGAWVVTLHQRTRLQRKRRGQGVTDAWILLYNPLLNVEEKVQIPIHQAWPHAKHVLLQGFQILGARGRNRLRLYAHAARDGCVMKASWNPVSGLIQTSPRPPSRKSLPVRKRLPPPQDVAHSAWTREYIGTSLDEPVNAWSQTMRALMAYSRSGLNLYQEHADKWEFVGAMPHDMWQLMRESRCFFLGTRGYYLIWTWHRTRRKQPEMVVLFQPAKDRWTWVYNISHSRSNVCQWNPNFRVMFPCF